MRIEVLLDVKTTLGEGPLWDVDQQRLYWADSFDGRVFRCTVDGRELRAWDLPQKIGAMALRKDGQGAILTLQRGFHTLDFKTGEVELIRDPEPDKLQNRLNDGKVDGAGRSRRVYEHTGRIPARPRSTGWIPTSPSPKSTATSSVRTVLASVQTTRHSILPTVDPAEIGAYATTMLRPVRSATGACSPRLVGAMAARATAPRWTARGYLWDLLLRLCRLRSYALRPNGAVERIIEMPVKKVTSVMFGGPNLDILFVTSMAKPAASPLPRRRRAARQPLRHL